MPSFQCIVVVYTEDLSMERKMTWIPIRHNLPVYEIHIEEYKECYVTFPNRLCGYSYGLYCTIKVS